MDAILVKESGDGRGVSDKELWKKAVAFWGLMYRSVVFRQGSVTLRIAIGSEEISRVVVTEQLASLRLWKNSSGFM
jgi:hypothetical protein